MLFASLYTLAPTFLQGDVQSRLLATTEAIDTPTQSTQVDFSVVFDVEGSAKTASKVVDSRLKSAGVAYERVDFEGGQVKVYVAAGTSDDAVTVLVKDTGLTVLHSLSVAGEASEDAQDPPAGTPSALISLLGDDGASWAGPLMALAGTSPEASALSLTVASAAASDDGWSVQTEGDWPSDTTAAVLTVDGVAHGVVFPADAEGRSAFVPFADLSDAVSGQLISGPLPGALTVVADEVVEVSAAADEPEGDAAEDEDATPPEWWESLLPEATLSLGLDLQGGIDLTLQVELDVAVNSQVRRDRKMVDEAALKDGFDLATNVERNRPVMRMRHAGEFSALQAFMADKLPQYVYLETLSDSEGLEWHAFRIQEERVKEISDQAVEQVLETLRKRVDSTGVKEPSVVKMGGGRINIQLPGADDPDKAMDAIGTQAVLEFLLVDEDADLTGLDRLLVEAEQTLPADQFNNDQLLNEILWSQGKVTEDRVVKWEYDVTSGEEVRGQPYMLKNDVILTGSDINNARVGWDQTQRPYVSLDFKPRGAKVFCDVTTANVRKRFAIVLDGQVRSAPNIRERICGGAASIEMGGAMEPLAEANTLALVLRTGSLNAPVSFGNISAVGASLGQDAIQSGFLGMAIGFGIILTFMALWYRASGMIADVALTLNVILVFALLAAFGATLTLPGFAGIALTVGMAVDANIIIYERIREELRLGVHARKAVETGYEKGVVAVLDANITTAIAGVVLYSYGTGPIKGFAVTLLIGIFTTLVTALFVTRTLMELSTRNSSARLSI
jgi:preprotein translocase subunit SecD